MKKRKKQGGGAAKHTSSLQGRSLSSTPDETSASNAGSHSATEAGSTLHARRANSGIGRDFLIGILFTIFLVGVKLIVERTSWGEQLDMAAYRYEQSLLARVARTENLPVVVVDIGDLPAVPIPGSNGKEMATPRDPLNKLISAIAERGPAAIGVDIDVSPEYGMPITPGDPAFFEECLSQPVPVFLGVSRAQTRSSQEWLGDDRYKRLAASLIIPRHSSNELDYWIHTDQMKEPLLTLSASLASIVRQSALAKPWWKSWAFRPISTRKLSKEISVGEFPVDYSPLEALQSGMLEMKDFLRGTNRSAEVTGKMVLVGDGVWEHAIDKFNVPGRQETVPGIFLHACAAFTLAQAPLSELTAPGRLSIDIFLSLAVLGLLAAIRWHYRKKTEKLATHRLQYLLTILVALLAFAFGVELVGKTRVLWNDFILVIAVLLLHPVIERLVDSMREWMHGPISGAWHRLIFESAKKETK